MESTARVGSSNTTYPNASSRDRTSGVVTVQIAMSASGYARRTFVKHSNILWRRESAWKTFVRKTATAP